MVEDDDPVGALHGGQPVGDDDRRPAAHRRFQRCLHDPLAFGVETAGRFVEQQQGRVLEDRAGDGDALPLAAGQANATLTDESGIAFRQPVHEFVDEGGSRGGTHLFVAGLGPAVADVVGNAAREDHCFLRHHRDTRAQFGQAHMAQIDAINPDDPFADVVEALQQLEDGRLAGARRTDQGHRLTGADAQIEAVQYRLGRA